MFYKSVNLSRNFDLNHTNKFCLQEIPVNITVSDVLCSFPHDIKRDLGSRSSKYEINQNSTHNMF